METISYLIAIPVILLVVFCVYKLFTYKKQKKIEIGPLSSQIFAPAKLPENIDSIVIGSGISGLTCAANLAKSGHQVVVLEKHQKAGGCLHTYTHKGYEFDTGLHFLGNMYRTRLEHDLLSEIVEQPIEFAKMQGGKRKDACEVIEINGNRYELPSGVENYRHALYDYFPDDKHAIDAFIEKVKKADDVFGMIWKIKLLPNCLSFLANYLYSRISKDIDQTVEQVVNSITSNMTLRYIFSYYYMIAGGSPAEISFPSYAAVFWHYINGSYYPVKGSSDISHKISEYIFRRGGYIFTKVDVKQLLFNEDYSRVIGVKVMYQNKIHEIRANNVISGVGLYNTYNVLLSEYPELNTLPSYQALQQLIPSENTVSIELVVDASPEEIGIDGCNYWFLDGNTDISQKMNDFLTKPERKISAVYCTCTSAKSKYFHDKYPGKTLIQLLTYGGDYKWYEKWKNERPMMRSEGYTEIKDQIANQMLQVIYERWPLIKNKEMFHYSSSPLTNEYFINSANGSVYGMRNTPEKFANWEKFKFQSPFKGLYLCSQDMFLHGVLGAFFSGYFCAASVAPSLYVNLIKVGSKSSYE